jgi:hypothetical protein
MKSGGRKSDAEFRFVENPYLPPCKNAELQSGKRSRINRTVLLLLFVLAGSLAGWGCGYLLLWQNPFFTGTGATFLMLWALAILAGGSCGAFAAKKVVEWFERKKGKSRDGLPVH